MIKQQLDQDLKTALLSKDTITTTVIRSLKSAILYAEVAAHKRDEGLSDDEIIVVLHKEAKKRQESADMYMQAKSIERAEAEQGEKVIISKYLPEPISEEKITETVANIIAAIDNPTMQVMGQVIGSTKKILGASADGALIAKIVKERLSK